MPMNPGNRSSLVGVQPLPVITENPDASPSIPSPTPISPTQQKRRSLPTARTPSPSYPTYPAGYPTYDGTWNRPSPFPPTQQPRRMSSPSPRRPSPHHQLPPPSPYLRHSSISDQDNEKELVPPILPLPLPQREKDWFTKRGGWWRVALYGVLFVGIAVGLAVGLSVGLKKSVAEGEEGGMGMTEGEEQLASSSSAAATMATAMEDTMTSGEATVEATTMAGISTTTEDGAATETPDSVIVLPTGEFEFKTTLVNRTDECGENWSCQIDSDDTMEATFRLAIAFLEGKADDSTSDASGYRISMGDQGPFQVESGFREAKIKVVDLGTENERIVALGIENVEKVVAVEGGGGCVFETSLEVVLWTQRKKGAPTAFQPREGEETTGKRVVRRDSGELTKRRDEWEFMASFAQAAKKEGVCIGVEDREEKEKRGSLPRLRKRQDRVVNEKRSGSCGCWWANF